MKLSTPILLAAAGLASATPLRVVYIGGDVAGAASANIEMGPNGVPVVRPLPAAQAGAHAGLLRVEKAVHVPHHPVLSVEAIPVVPGHPVHAHAHAHAEGTAMPQGCAGRLRQKAAGMITSIKIAFGWSSKTVTHAKTPGGDVVRIVSVSGHAEGPKHIHHAQHKHHGDKAESKEMWRYHHVHHESGRTSFGMRVQYALLSLGPWEGRAVAFVLGCGIGVLLRMFWVLAVLSFRAIRSSREPAADYYYGELEGEDAEEIFVAPPMYTVPVVVTIDAQGFPVEKVEESK